MVLDLKTTIKLPDPIKTENHMALPIKDNRGVCASFHALDKLDSLALAYAKHLISSEEKPLYAADLGCSPYFPQAIRFAQQGLTVDAFDIEDPIEEYQAINQELNNKINYVQTDLKKLTEPPYHAYSIVYSNRFISHINYFEARNLLLNFIDRAKDNCRFFLSLGSLDAIKGDYPDRNKPVEERYSKSTFLAEQHQLTELVWLYNLGDIYQKLLKDLPIKLIDEFAGSASFKIIFSKKTNQMKL